MGLRHGSREKSAWKVGDLAGRTGLSVRTLHHYDEIGLLSPSGRTGSGHRLYSAEDVLRLQRIRSLRALGFSLEEIRESAWRIPVSRRAGSWSCASRA